MLKFSDSLTVFSKEERSSVNNLFDRETRRERILSTIEKEESFNNKNVVKIHVDTEDNMEEKLKKAEEHYYETIRNERDQRVASIQKLFDSEEKDI